MRKILAEGMNMVCVVRYRVPAHRVAEGDVVRLEGFDYGGGGAPANPAVLLQVCVKPGKVFGDLIRFGESPGDEISGWQWIDAFEVVAVLGELQGDGKTVVPLVSGCE